MNNQEFKPLSEWDLQEGIIVEDKVGNRVQYAGLNLHWLDDYTVFLTLNFKDTLVRPTTAHDAGLDSEDLPIEEPFWTGWVFINGREYPVLRYHYGVVGGVDVLEEIECKDKLNSKFSPVDCVPCLPPPITDLDPLTCDLQYRDITNMGVVKIVEPNSYWVESLGYETRYLRDELRLTSRGGRPVVWEGEKLEELTTNDTLYEEIYNSLAHSFAGWDNIDGDVVKFATENIIKTLNRTNETNTNY